MSSPRITDPLMRNPPEDSLSQMASNPENVLVPHILRWNEPKLNKIYFSLT